MGKSFPSLNSLSETFVSGTKIVFSQPSAPTGWTQDTSLNDHMLRVVSGAGGSSGGSDSPILMDKVPIHNHNASSNTTGNHSHTYSTNVSDRGGDGPTTPFAYNRATLNTSTAGNHSHTITVDNNSGSNWTPKYIDTIICTKD